MLIKLIREHAPEAAQAGDWSAVAVTLNAPTIEFRDTTLRSTGWLMQQLSRVIDPTTGMTEADLVLGTLQRSTVPRVRAAYDRMSAVGLDLSDPQVQGMLPLLAAGGGWPAGLADRIKSAGISIVSPAGLSRFGTVTAEQCQAASEAAETAVANQRTAAIRQARITSIQSLDATAIVDGNASLASTMDDIRTKLASFGSWS